MKGAVGVLERATTVTFNARVLRRKSRLAISCTLTSCRGPLPGTLEKPYHSKPLDRKSRGLRTPSSQDGAFFLVRRWDQHVLNMASFEFPSPSLSHSAASSNTLTCARTAVPHTSAVSARVARNFLQNMLGEGGLWRIGGGGMRTSQKL